MPILGHTLQCIVPSWLQTLYDACPESKDTKVLNMYNIFNLKSDTVNELPVHNFIFQHCPNIYEVLEPTYVSPSHRSLPPALWIMSWLLLAPHRRRRTFSQRDVTLGEETSGNRWARGPDCTADDPETSTRNPSVSFCDRPLTFWAPRVRTIFCTLIFSVTASWIVVLDTSGMMWCNSLIVTRRFARISSSIYWRRPSEIKHGLPLLCSSWTSDLPSENSRHHFVTFCRFITSP